MCKSSIYLLAAMLISAGCNQSQPDRNIYVDTPFRQDYSVKYYCDQHGIKLRKVACDRNDNIQIYSSEGLLKPFNGKLLYPGTIGKDNSYRPLSDKKISSVGIYHDQFIYIDDKAVTSNALAGKLYSPHSLKKASILEGGPDFTFMVSDGKELQLIRDSGTLWRGTVKDDEIRDIIFDRTDNSWWILCRNSIYVYYPGEIHPSKILEDTTLTCFALSQDKIIAGTTRGYYTLNTKTHNPGTLQNKMPWPELTAIKEIDSTLWFGSTNGAMMLKKDGRFSYYASERWLPSDTVTDIAKGPDGSILVLTNRGLAIITYDEITLHDKALFFEKQVRERHIRNGFNATLSGMNTGNLSTGSMEDSDNDGLWTSMYLAAEAFRYSVSRSGEALQNIRESLDAMERLYSITPVPGFPARSFERRGYKYEDAAWRRAEDPEWDWKSTTSSDEAIGHIFAFGVIAELIDDVETRNKAVLLIDTLMSHIVKNDFYLIDWDGKPTRWGRWNPEYVNAFPPMIGDRKLNSSNIIGMLQTAYRFTGKEKYREAAFYLMTEHGYLENLMKPFSEIGFAPGDADGLSRLLSDGWNHSDDEMYFLGYWGLYRYALNDTLKRKYREAIIDHRIAERPEREGLWNIMAYIAGEKGNDPEEAVWYLKEYPVDLIEWDVRNSHRKDIVQMEPNFRNQTITEVLPPDELRIARHNANRFVLDGGNGGKSEMSAGDIWLLPYWMGRYLGVISAPQQK